MHCRARARSNSKPWYDRDVGDGTRPPFYIWLALASVALAGLGVVFGSDPKVLIVPLVSCALAVLAWCA